VVLVLLLGDPGQRGGPLDHLRGAALVLGASLRAWVFAKVDVGEDGSTFSESLEYEQEGGDDYFVGELDGSTSLDTDGIDVTVDGFDGGASTSLLLVPLVVTFLLLGLTAHLARRAERATPSGTGQQLVGTATVSAVVGLVGVVAVTLVGRTGDVFGFSGDLDEADGADASYGVDLTSLLLWGFALLLVAGLVDRLTVWLPVQRGSGLAAHARELTRGVSDWFGTGALHAVLSGLGVTALVVVPYAMTYDTQVDADSRADVLGLAVLLVLAAPTYVLALGGLGMGIQAGAAGESIGIFSGEVDDVLRLGLLVPLAVSIVLGARRALRSDPAAELGRQALVAAGGFAAFWVLASLVLVGGTRADFFGSIELVVRPTTLTLLLVPAAWGALTVVLGRFVARTLMVSAPARAEALAGAGLHQGWRGVV
jgi:hypothetical protein